MLNALLSFYCGKNSTKRKKVVTVLDSMSYNDITKEYTCKSTRNDNTYVVFYSNSIQEWLCNCQAITWRKNKVREEGQRERDKGYCIHIISSIIFSLLLKQ